MIAVDLGSNTIRFIEFDGHQWLRSYEKIVRTAEGLHESGRICDNAIIRIIGAINEAKKELDFSLNEVVAYTTAAMRLATNSKSVLERIKTETGILFTIIDADKEAKLTLSAVRYRLGMLGIEPSSFLLSDIGGGSTELIRYEGGIVNTLSLNMGIVTLSESSGSLEELNKKIEHFKAEIKDSVDIGAETRLVMTAGTPTTIAAYLKGMDYENYDPDKINGTSLRLSDCYRVYDELLAMDEVKRTRFVGVGRENLIMAGIMMVSAIYEALNRDEAIIIDDGLREGIALEYFNLH